ncbi:hypothetical protein AKJ16_DCAP23662 [Drosera capensis]
MKDCCIIFLELDSSVIQSTMALFMLSTTARMDWSQLLPIRSMGLKRVGFGPAFYSSPQAVQPALEQNEGGIMCEPCRGMGWLLCDFCNGQKTNVKSKTSRIYRRCPTCKAIGCTLCTNCKVFKCVTFPEYGDGEDLSF